ncbi:helix-turn-helix transcriptional regulator [Fodinicola feengrottensis]|uniref:Helix-turn-helix transcriptional regulator n=1 Tax=Fodinicola feengrottensis TaxID=435914 RepID=A0ABP4UVJ2_9ACTN|nr:helix-turn-helix transcriptional regulator [Fodinicola feengrottensis]
MTVNELGAALRAWRDRLSPAEAGLKAEPRRRTPGLRRDEVARLAGISVDYVVLLEQGRAATPSPQVLTTLARALRLSDPERAHLFRLAGRALPAALPSVLPPSVRRLLDHIDAAVAVFNARWDPMATNAGWTDLLGDPLARAEQERNIAWRHFAGLPSRIVRTSKEESGFEEALVADLRRSYGKYPHDQELAALVARLNDSSERFQDLWRAQRVAAYYGERKTIGIDDYHCDILPIELGDVRVVIYTPVKVVNALPASGGLPVADLALVPTRSPRES